MSPKTLVICSLLLLCGLLSISAAIGWLTLQQRERGRFNVVPASSGVFILDTTTGHLWLKTRTGQEDLGTLDEPVFAK